MNAITLDLTGIVELNDEQFWQLCQQHRDYRFEKNTKGEIFIMSPKGGETGSRNADLIYQLQAWNRQYKLGNDVLPSFVLDLQTIWNLSID